MRKILRNEKGFTLIELLIVVVIIGILAAVAVPIYTRYITSARGSEAPTVMQAIIQYAKSYQRAHSAWPTVDGDSSVADGDWVDEVVGTSNRYFDYTYDAATTTIEAVGKGGASPYAAADVLQYRLANGADPWSSTGQCLEIEPTA